MNTLTLKQEVKLLRSAIIGIIGKDLDGEYNPKFVKEVLSELDRKPTKRFVNSKQFLEEIKKA